MNRINALAFVIVSLMGIMVVTTIQYGRAQFLGVVTIKADGTVDPANAPIQQSGEVYILTDDIESMRVEKSNMLLDGNGHMLPGEASSLPTGGSSYNSGVVLDNVENVTVKNLIIQNVQTGIFLDRTTKCIITNNTIAGTHVAVPAFQPTAGIFIWAGNSNTITENQLTNNYHGVYLGYDSQQNTITRNNITNSDNSGVIFWDASNNTIYSNNFIDNTMQACVNEERVNFWDNGSVGNYWKDYNGSDLNFDGIGDTPYLIDENNQDNYPLMEPYKEPEPTPTEPFPTILAAVATGTVAAVAVSAGLIVYFKKHRRQTSIFGS